MFKKPCKGEIVVVSGRKWCIGEKIISKWKHSKFNKSKKHKKTKKQKTNRRKTAKVLR